MKKIAVCLSGQIRYWEETYPFFEYWNNLFDDVEFTFFISTWKEKTWVDDKFGDLEIVDIDFDKHEFITSYSKHDHNTIVTRKDVLLSQKPITSYFTYLMKQVQTLRKEYEDKNNMKFDGVIQTRNDIFISYELLVRCIKTIKVENYFLKNSIFTPGGVSLHPYGPGMCLILQNDNFYFGISSVMDKLIGMYDYLNTDATKLMPHQLQAEFFNRNKIFNVKLGAEAPRLIRNAPVIKNGRPTSDSLLKIINERGIDWIFQKKLREVSEEYWSYN